MTQVGQPAEGWPAAQAGRRQGLRGLASPLNLDINMCALTRAKPRAGKGQKGGKDYYKGLGKGAGKPGGKHHGSKAGGGKGLKRPLDADVAMAAAKAVHTI